MIYIHLEVLMNPSGISTSKGVGAAAVGPKNWPIYIDIDIDSILSLVRTLGDRRNLIDLSGIRINRCHFVLKQLRRG